jgi:hypothetical protein
MAGVEIIIFRGNNRNRRRGFHNTYVFYRLVQEILNGKVVSPLINSEVTKREQLSLFL